MEDEVHVEENRNKDVSEEFDSDDRIEDKHSSRSATSESEESILEEINNENLNLEQEDVLEVTDTNK